MRWLPKSPEHQMKTNMRRYLPILIWGRAYNRAALSNEVVVALIVTIVLIPQSLAYALLAGLSAISCTVLSPHSASSATAALDWSEKLRRLVIRVSIRSGWVHLSTLSKFAEPIQPDGADELDGHQFTVSSVKGGRLPFRTCIDHDTRPDIIALSSCNL